MTDATAHASGTPEGTSASGRTGARTLPTNRTRLAPPKLEFSGVFASVRACSPVFADKKYRGERFKFP